jgi:hypothetical protein
MFSTRRGILLNGFVHARSRWKYKEQCIGACQAGGMR